MKKGKKVIKEIVILIITIIIRDSIIIRIWGSLGVGVISVIRSMWIIRNLSILLLIKYRS